VCSYSKVENYIPVTIHFNHVFEFGVGNHAYGSRQRCSKFQYHAHAALSQQTKVVVFTQVVSQVERLQRVSIAVVFATNKQTFVSALPSSLGKQTVVGSYILPRLLVWLNGSHGVLLLSVQVQRYLVHIEMLGIGPAVRQVSIERSVAHQFDNYARGKLPGKQFLVTQDVVLWTEAFLINRKQRVQVNNQFSSWSNVISGIPQGSILGPLLFIIYINDLIDACHNSALFLYADDSKMYKYVTEFKHCLALQEDIDNLNQWAGDWKLKLNVPKCSVVSYGRKNLSTR